MTLERDLILLTSFEPFGGSDRNFSIEVVERLSREGGLIAPGIEVVARCLPVAFDRAFEALWQAFLALRKKPVMVVSFGEADRGRISLETAASNHPFQTGSPEREGFAFPVQAMAEALAPGDLERVELSVSPGRFVCNQTAYLGSLRFRAAGIPYTFIHVPNGKHDPGPPNADDAASRIGRLLGAALAFNQGPQPRFNSSVGRDYPLPHASNSRRLPSSRVEVDELLSSRAAELSEGEIGFLGQLRALYDKEPT